MKKAIDFGISIVVVAALLAGCGGGNGSSNMSSSEAGNQASMAIKALTPRNKAAVVTDYNDAVQELYVAYYGRPADPAGLAYWEGVLLADNAPTDIQTINSVYATNAAVKSVVDSFGTSAESTALYGSGTPSTFVTAIYQNVLGRGTDAAGLAYWAGLIGSNTITQADAALAILASAAAEPTTSSDEQVVNNRLVVANYFTGEVSSLNTANAYSGDTATASARSMLAGVSATTDTNAYQVTAYNTINGLVVAVFAQVQAIVVQRCVPCHSSHPTEPGYTSAPLGYMYDTAAEIANYASLMYENAVVTTFMPYGNATGMTTAERNTFGAWYLAGALQTASSTPITTPPDPDPDPDPDPGW